jgi:ATP phosphoribosyltransferase regulatory subunit HisZ
MYDMSGENWLEQFLRNFKYEVISVPFLFCLNTYVKTLDEGRELNTFTTIKHKNAF